MLAFFRWIGNGHIPIIVNRRIMTVFQDFGVVLIHIFKQIKQLVQEIKGAAMAVIV